MTNNSHMMKKNLFKFSHYDEEMTPSSHIADDEETMSSNSHMMVRRQCQVILI